MSRAHDVTTYLMITRANFHASIHGVMKSPNRARRLELRSKCCASLLHVDDDADLSPANLGRPVELIKSNFGADAEVHHPTIPCRASSRQCAVGAA
jgi:hypothetical protein